MGRLALSSTELSKVWVSWTHGDSTYMDFTYKLKDSSAELSTKFRVALLHSTRVYTGFLICCLFSSSLAYLPLCYLLQPGSQTTQLFHCLALSARWGRAFASPPPLFGVACSKISSLGFRILNVHKPPSIAPILSQIQAFRSHTLSLSSETLDPVR